GAGCAVATERPDGQLPLLLPVGQLLGSRPGARFEHRRRAFELAAVAHHALALGACRFLALDRQARELGALGDPGAGRGADTRLLQCLRERRRELGGTTFELGELAAPFFDRSAGRREPPELLEPGAHLARALGRDA